MIEENLTILLCFSILLMFAVINVWDQAFEFSLHVRSIYVKSQTIKMFTFREETMVESLLGQSLCFAKQRN